MRQVRVKAVRRIERGRKTVETQSETRRELLTRVSALASVRISATNRFLIIKMEIKTASEDTKSEDADEGIKSQGARRRREDHVGRQKHKDQADK